MPRKKAEVDETIFDVAPNELDSVLAGLADDETKIKIYRIKGQGAPSFVAEFEPSNFNEEAIKNTYGGGRYKYVAIANGEVVRQGRFEIEGPTKTQPVFKRYDANGRLIFSTPSDADVMLMGQQQSQSESALLIELARIREELRELKSGDGAKSEENFLRKLALYKELFSPTQPQNQTVNEVAKYAVDLIKQGLELGATAEGGGTPWYILLAEKALPIINKAVDAIALQQHATNARIPVNGLSIPQQGQPQNQPSPPSSPLPQSGFDQMADRLRPFLPTFLSAASANIDPASLIDVTAANVPLENKDDVIKWLESPQWFSDLVKLHPIIQGQSAWWQDFRAGLLEALKQVESDQETME